jgi:predicted RNA-binding Zn-ribbon protein involved in translation (DUF1610 family)
MTASGIFLGGIFLTVLTSALNALAFLFQKLGHHRAALSAHKVPPAPSETSKLRAQTAAAPPSFLAQPLWWCGILCILVAASGAAIVLTLLGQSTAAALNIQVVAFSAVLSAIVLKEQFSWVDGVVTIFIISGAAVSAYSSSAGGGDIVTFRELLALLSRPASYLTATGVGVAWALAWAFIAYANLSRSRANPQSATLGTPKDALRAAELLVRTLLAGVFASFAALLTKIFMVGIATAARKGDPLLCVSAWEWWLALVGIAASFSAQMTWINSAIAIFPSLEVIPLYQGAVTISGIGCGFVFLDEVSRLPPGSLGVFALGAAVSVCGVTLLLLKRSILRMCPSCGLETLLRRSLARVLGPSWLPVPRQAPAAHRISFASATGAAAVGPVHREPSARVQRFLSREQSRTRFASFALGRERSGSHLLAGLGVSSAASARGGDDDLRALANFSSRASFAGFLGLPDPELDAALDGVGEEGEGGDGEAGGGAAGDAASTRSSSPPPESERAAETGSRRESPDAPRNAEDGDRSDDDGPGRSREEDEGSSRLLDGAVVSRR